MQPETSKDPGQISIKNSMKALEMVTITKQRRNIFLVETKRTLNADLQVVKFAQVVFIPNRSNDTGRNAYLNFERESLREKRSDSVLMVAHAQFFTKVFQESRLGRSDSFLKFKG